MNTLKNNKKLRIIIDLDGTICEIRKSNESYEDVKPKKGAVKFLKLLKQSGHTIVIHTARNMQTQNNNVGLVMKNVGLVTLQWLEKHEIPYDEIFFGKPNGDITIDDRAFRFSSWNDISESQLLNLAKDK